jgi:hypothetical protein
MNTDGVARFRVTMTRVRDFSGKAQAAGDCLPASWRFGKRHSYSRSMPFGNVTLDLTLPSACLSKRTWIAPLGVG